MSQNTRIITTSVILGLIMLVLFDHAMRADKARLCASDATAYEGCDR